METVNSQQQWPPIELAWRQKLAAFWSISWPSLLASWLLMVFLSGILTSNRIETVDSLGVRGEVAALVSNLAFLLGQIILIPRLFRKRYRSFRLEVLRQGDAKNPKLSAQEKIRVGIRLAWPQAAYMVLTALVVSWAGAVVDDPAATRGIGSMLFWLRFLLVGPYAIHFAIPRDYPSFRLEAYGQRYV